MYRAVGKRRAVLRGTVEHLGVFAVVGHAEAVACARYGHEVADDYHLVSALIKSAENYYALAVIVVRDPREALPCEVALPKRRSIFVEIIQPADIFLIIPMAVIFLYHEPFQTVFVIPLSELRELAAHEKQLLSGVRHHVSHEKARLRELHIGISAEHFVYQ